MGDKFFFTCGGKKLLEYFIQLLKNNHLHVFSQGYSHNFSKTLTQLIVLFYAFKFSAASFNSVTSSRFTVLKKSGRHLSTDGDTRAVAIAISHVKL